MHELKPGDPHQIGPYHLRGRLGAGGMGQVFLGLSAGGRPVAVKLIHADLAQDPEFRERFRREIAVARKVSGLFTAPVIDADVDAPVPWLATAYVPGPSLADGVSQRGPLPVASVLALARGLAEGLSAIHAAGVVHRDLKPANVLLAADGPRVIDFGISRAAEASALTRTGLVVDSPGFMSPEQADGREVGPPSDIFSLGAVLAFAATGQGPFGTGSAPALVYRVVYSLPDLDRLPAEVRPLIERCLDKDPARRPSAAQLLTEADAAYPVTAWRPEPATRTFIQGPAVTPKAATEPGLIHPGSAATRLGLGTVPLGPPTATAAVAPPPGEQARRQPRLSRPGPRPRRRSWRALAVTALAGGLLAGSAATGFALTGSSGHVPRADSRLHHTVTPTVSPATSAPAPTASARTSPPTTATPGTSAPADVPPSPSPSATASASPATSASPSASALPSATMSPLASTSPAPATAAPATTTAAP